MSLTPSSQASSRGKAALCLLSRGVGPAFVRWKGDGFTGHEKKPPARGAEVGTVAGISTDNELGQGAGHVTVAEAFLSTLGCSDCPTLAEGLAEVFATAYKNEGAFDTTLFDELFKCFRSSNVYKVEKQVKNGKSMIVLTPNDASKRCLVQVDGTSFEFAVCLVQKPTLSERKGSAIEGRPEPDHAWALCRKKSAPPAPERSRRIAAAAAVGSEQGHDGSGPVSSVCHDTVDRATGDSVAAVVHNVEVAMAANAAGGDASVLDQEIRSKDGDPEGDDELDDDDDDELDDELDDDELDDDDDDDYYYKPPRNEDVWEVFRVLASVELKLHAACKQPFKTLPQGAVNEDEIKLDSDHWPLAQALMYAIGVTLWDRAALGLDLPESLPVAVVAVRQVSDPSVLKAQNEEELGATRHDATRWLHGNLLIPEQCGGLFSYNVDGFGMFSESTGASALAAYLDVMAEGLRAATQWFKRVQESGRPAPPRSMTGQKLSFPGRGDEDVLNSLTHLSSPLAPSSDAHFRISQGELFQWTLNLKSLYRDTTQTRSHQVYWCSEDGHDLPDQNRTVLVKVTSKVCYGLITDGQGFLYRMGEYEKGRAPETVRRVFRLLKDSVYAVHVPINGSGVVQIIPDLRDQGYQQLRPSAQWHTAEAWIAAWTAFKNLVRDVLISLAEADLIHVDLRPGFDVTANILHSQNTSKMLLIDVDSLVTFDAWQKLSMRRIGSNLISARRNSVYPTSSLEYVLWQGICLAETWISGTSHRDVHVRTIVDAKRDRVNSLLPNSSSSYDRALIMKELDEYDKHFDGVGAAERAAASARAMGASSAAAASLSPRQAGAGAGAAAPAVPVTQTTSPRRGETSTGRKRQLLRTS